MPPSDYFKAVFSRQSFFKQSFLSVVLNGPSLFRHPCELFLVLLGRLGLLRSHLGVVVAFRVRSALGRNFEGTTNHQTTADKTEYHLPNSGVSQSNCLLDRSKAVQFFRVDFPPNRALESFARLPLPILEDQFRQRSRPILDLSRDSCGPIRYEIRLLRSRKRWPR